MQVDRRDETFWKDPDVEDGDFLLYKPLGEVICLLSQHDLVVLDEISQLNAEQYEFIVPLWEADGRVPALMLLGDFWELPTILDTVTSRCMKVSNGTTITSTDRLLRGGRLAQDPVLAKKLGVLRYRVSDRRNLATSCGTTKPGTDTTAWDILQLMEDELKTTIVSCTRFSAATVNELAVQVLFADQHKLSS